MALHLILLSLTHFLFLLPLPTLSQTPSAPAPGPAGPINVTGILVQGGQFTAFLRLLNQTQVLTQITSQLNHSDQGMTLFAPTDNAFQNLPAGTLNGLDDQEKVKLCLYHVLPKYYSMADLVTVSNPVRTQATGNNGVFGLNFTGQATQVNVSTGAVVTQVNNALRQQFPFAVYQVDKVLLPVEFTEAPAPEGEGKAPSAEKPTKTAPSSPTAVADGPAAPASGVGRGVDVGLGLVGGVAVFCMALL